MLAILVDKKSFRSHGKVNQSDDMLRVTIDIQKRDWFEFQKKLGLATQKSDIEMKKEMMLEEEMDFLRENTSLTEKQIRDKATDMVNKVFSKC